MQHRSPHFVLLRGTKRCIFWCKAQCATPLPEGPSRIMCCPFPLWPNKNSLRDGLFSRATPWHSHSGYEASTQITHDSAHAPVVSSARKLTPCGIFASKFSAMVCPMSASVERVPKFTVAPPGEYAMIGTYSREWSVVSQRGSGSQP